MGRHVTEGRCQGNTTGTDKAALSIEASRNSQTACRQEAALTVQPDDQTEAPLLNDLRITIPALRGALSQDESLDRDLGQIFPAVTALAKRSPSPWGTQLQQSFFAWRDSRVISASKLTRERDDP
ncbi:hypothetical protein WJX79_006224 [Trebouxia sp. C0005]